MKKFGILNVRGSVFCVCDDNDLMKQIPKGLIDEINNAYSQNG